MRWNNKKPQVRDKRIKNKFLLFPKEINGEVRWLEKAKYDEIYSIDYEYQFYEWVACSWINE